MSAAARPSMSSPSGPIDFAAYRRNMLVEQSIRAMIEDR